MSEQDDLVDALTPVVSAFNKLGVPHCVGGSIASAFHGAVRSTMDVDLLCELQEDQIADFLTCFDQDFYVSESAVRDAVLRNLCFNLIHLPTSFKVDVFISPGRDFDQTRIRRATMEKLGEDPSVMVPMTTAEDSIISKLEWYRKSDETSERQWDDVSRLMQLLGSSADLDYLRKAAEATGVEDLLDRLVKAE